MNEFTCVGHCPPHWNYCPECGQHYCPECGRQLARIDEGEAADSPTISESPLENERLRSDFGDPGRECHNLVIGGGEVGTAIANLLDCPIYDIKHKGFFDYKKVYALHICIPYTDNFSQIVRTYEEVANPDLVIVHSTVPVGTCDPNGWVHSPIRGKHPNLEKSIKTFPKYFGGALAHEAVGTFEDICKCYWAHTAKITEALKLWDTAQYGFNIILEKAIFDYCGRNRVDYNFVYNAANHTYNDGYKKLDCPEYQKYALKHKPGRIGGHCVMENFKLLNDPFVNEFLELAKRYLPELLEQKLKS